MVRRLLMWRFVCRRRGVEGVVDELHATDSAGLTRRRRSGHRGCTRRRRHSSWSAYYNAKGFPRFHFPVCHQFRVVRPTVCTVVYYIV